jgi:DegV family protein with EDD domain
VVPLTIIEGEESFPDDGRYTAEALYARFRADGTLPQTAAISPQSFMDYFRPLLAEGYDVVHIDISAELSSTYQNACLAAEELSDLGEIHCVDSRHLSTGGALLALRAAALRDQGMSARDIAAQLRQLTEKVDTSFVLDTLEYMWKGGRCSGVAALGANLLRLKPCLEMREGKLVVAGKKFRGAIEKVYPQYIVSRLTGVDVDPEYVFITHSGEVPEETLEALVQQVKELGGFREVFITRAGCTVSSHCGPKTLGVLFLHR